MFADWTKIAGTFCTCRVFKNCHWNNVCIAEPWYSVGALPQCAISRRQQAGSNHTKPGSLGWQEGVDQGRTGVTTQAHVWVAICSLYILYIFYFFCFLLQWCWCFPGWSENRSVLPAASSPFFIAWLLIRSNFIASCIIKHLRDLLSQSQGLYLGIYCSLIMTDVACYKARFTIVNTKAQHWTLYSFSSMKCEVLVNVSLRSTLILFILWCGLCCCVVCRWIVFWGFTSTLQMEAVSSSGTLISTYQAAWCYNTEGHKLNLHHCENLKSDILIFCYCICQGLAICFFIWDFTTNILY